MHINIYPKKEIIKPNHGHIIHKPLKIKLLTKTHKPIKKNYDEKKEPKMAVVDYLYTNEKKSLNRNSILKPIENKQSFEELFSFCNNIFVKKGKNNKEIETNHF